MTDDVPNNQGIAIEVSPTYEQYPPSYLNYLARA